MGLYKTINNPLLKFGLQFIPKSPKIYKALLSQSGIIEPTAIIKKDTLHEAFWSYVSPGVYRLNKVGAFSPSSVFIFIEPTQEGYGNSYVIISEINIDYIEIRTTDGSSEVDDILGAYHPQYFYLEVDA